ncbi:MAG: hydrogenase maturation protein [Deltaproteobacteria bacterium]|nr:hydrogenase maturation protein [Deltaproteobacteria bacterium]
MHILLLAHSFNSLTQRVHVELRHDGHEVSVELDVNDQVTAEAVALFRPDVLVAPYLRRRIPDEIWRVLPCIVLHPGIPGDRGPSALDWAVLEGEERWGVTALQANAELDGGEVWASATFLMRAARKGSLYRFEVTEAAVRSLREALARLGRGERPSPLAELSGERTGRARRRMRATDRPIEWSTDPTETVLRKLHSADGAPGVEDDLDGLRIRCFDAWPEGALRGTPGTWLAQRDGALCRATRDGAVWLGQLQAVRNDEATFKLPAAMVLGSRVGNLPELDVPLEAQSTPTFQPFSYRERDGVGHLTFELYNGALGPARCRHLLAALRHALSRPTRALVLHGGHDFFCNGLDLNLIEASPSPAETSWVNIQAIDDVVLTLLSATDRITVAALHGNAAAGGFFLALACDWLFAREGVVLNPHYKSMGNLYGSEYWTYTLPRKVGREHAEALTQGRLPMGTVEAERLGLIDQRFEGIGEAFRAAVHARVVELTREPAAAAFLADKTRRRAEDERERPLAAYRAAELEAMHRSFFGFDASYHVARYHFVHKTPLSRTPLHLALHR